MNLRAIKRAVARAAGLALYHSGLLGVLERLRRRSGEARVFILNYHRVADDGLGLQNITISPENFRSQMAYLAHGRYKPVSLTRLVRHLRGEETLEGNCVVVTFDDGYRDNYSNAFPILEELRVPATIFLTTGALDKQQPLWWDKVGIALRAMQGRPAPVTAPDERIPAAMWERVRAAAAKRDASAEAAIADLLAELKRVDPDRREAIADALWAMAPSKVDDLMMTWDMARAMRGSVIEFGAHTVTHPIMSQLDAERARAELRDAKARIEAELGEEVVTFAYPNGKAADFTEETVGLLTECGYEMALTTEKGVNDRDTDPFRMRRYGISNAPAYVLAVRLCAIALLDDLRGLLGKRRTRS